MPSFRPKNLPVMDYPVSDLEKLNMVFQVLNERHRSIVDLHYIFERYGWEETDFRLTEIKELLLKSNDADQYGKGRLIGFKPNDSCFVNSKKHGSYIAWKQNLLNKGRL